MEKVVHEIDAKKVTDQDKATACLILMQPEKMVNHRAYKRIKASINGGEITGEDIVKLLTDKDFPLTEYRKYKDEILPSDEPTGTWINEKDEQFVNMSGVADDEMEKFGKQMMSYLYVYKNLTKFRVKKWVDEYKNRKAIGIIDWELQKKISDVLNEKLIANLPMPTQLISIKELSVKWNIRKNRIVSYLKNGCLPSTWCNEFTDLNYLDGVSLSPIPMAPGERQIWRSQGKAASLDWYDSTEEEKTSFYNSKTTSKKRFNDKLFEKKFIPLSGVKSFEMKAETIRVLRPDRNASSQANIDNTHVYRMLQLLIDKVENIENQV